MDKSTTSQMSYLSIAKQVLLLFIPFSTGSINAVENVSKYQAFVCLCFLDQQAETGGQLTPLLTSTGCPGLCLV